ncbi:MAG TPA: hypothetical protein DCF33_09615 [Saprospirales bacterium]|nr:hypothetical protein [Saprospirales bacterium]
MLTAQNPHGPALKIDCAACHTSSGWEIASAYWKSFDPDKPEISKMTGMVLPFDTMRFHHGKTKFPLTGQHAAVDCRACHQTLIFSEAEGSDCISCHEDMHQQTVGTDCSRCHSTANWMLDDVGGLHQQNGFPLQGVHQKVDCNQCHQSASALQFERLGNQCVDCHLQDFQTTTQPDHKKAGFSTDCQECHDLTTPGW